MAHILFAGFGDLGGHAGRLLADAGHRVTALKRTPVAETTRLRVRTVDLAQPFRLDEHPDAVVIVVSPAQHDAEGYRATYVGAVRNTLAALRAVGARPARVLFVSSSSVWGENSGQWVTEDTPAQAEGYNGEVLLQAEQLLFDSGYPATTLRLAGIYGPGRYWLVRKAEAINAGREPWPVPSYSNRIHRDDAARLIAWLVQRALGGHVLERCYIGVDHEPSLNTDVLAYIAGLLKVRAGTDNPDQDGLAMSAVAAPVVRAAVGGKRLSNARVRISGFEFLYPDYRSGYAAVLADHKPLL